MNTVDASTRWRATWLPAWPAKDAVAIAELYADDATYRSHPFRELEDESARGYVTRAFSQEREGTRCWFGEPVVDGDRAAIEYWAQLEDLDGEVSTLAGVSVLTFRSDGAIVDHLDYWVMQPGAAEPPSGWGRASSKGR